MTCKCFLRTSPISKTFIQLLTEIKLPLWRPVFHIFLVNTFDMPNVNQNIVLLIFVYNFVFILFQSTHRPIICSICHLIWVSSPEVMFNLLRRNPIVYRTNSLTKDLKLYGTGCILRSFGIEERKRRNKQ